jgi:hypothetical protein
VRATSLSRAGRTTAATLTRPSTLSPPPPPQEVVSANKEARAAAAAEAEVLLAEEQLAFEAWRDSLETVRRPAVCRWGRLALSVALWSRTVVEATVTSLHLANCQERCALPSHSTFC